jgi:hypothetical protein
MALVTKNFSDIITFTRASTATFFNSAGVLTSAATNAPRFDYNPSTLAAQGLLIEESRTNSIRNNTMVGAVAGTPGTLPTNWTILGGGVGTLTQQVVGTGTLNGINYIDYRVSGTTSTTGFTLSFEQSAQIVAVNGQTWASSAWASLIGGSTTNITALNLTIDGRTAAGAYVGVVNGLSLMSATSTFARYTSTGTIANASVERVVLGIVFLTASGVAIDITLRIGLPQLELGAFATSVIPTTTTALTRAADVASVNTLSPWFNSVEGTLYAQASVISTSYNQGVLADIGAVGAFGTTEYLNWNGSGWTLSPNTAPINVTSVVTTSSTAKMAAAIKANDSVISANGLIGVVDTACAVPLAPTTLSIGKAGWSAASNFFNGWIQRITYYPRRLSNAELQAITA